MREKELQRGCERGRVRERESDAERDRGKESERWKNQCGGELDQ